MNQVALSCIILRVLGIYLILSYTGVFAAQVWWQLVSSFQYPGNELMFFISLAITVVIPFGVGVVLVLFAKRLSVLLFPDNRDVITAGSINGDALFYVGVALIGLYFFITYAPYTLVSLIDWFRATAETPTVGEYREAPINHLDFGGLLMVLLSLVLIFRRRTICDFLNRVSK